MIKRLHWRQMHHRKQQQEELLFSSVPQCGESEGYLYDAHTTILGRLDTQGKKVEMGRLAKAKIPKSYALCK